MPIYRIEVHDRPEQPDPRGQELRRRAESMLGCATGPIRCADIYLIDAELSADRIGVLMDRLLADPITQHAVRGVAERVVPDSRLIEVHPLPGVMDPVAQSVESVIRQLFGVDSTVRTGTRYDIGGVSEGEARRIAERLLANPVIHATHLEPHHPDSFPRGHTYALRIQQVPLSDMDDAALKRLSRAAHLFLSLDEMRAIQGEFARIGREPTDIELETLAQTWSEHCVHKTLKAKIRYRGDLPDASGRPGHTVNNDGSITIDNLLKSTVVAATRKLMAQGVDWCLSVFVDNAGIIAFDDDWAVCFKVETHNHPSAIEPYGGAATGIGGCIRDIIGTGLAAKPIASTDVFCVADARLKNADLPAGCLHPRRILTEIVAGVRDYGNRMGIPTINGAVWFDNRYVGNPLVYCGCVGLLPRDKVSGEARAGDRIIVLGGSTGRDGIHGATFSSAELTDTHADEFGHAVQIGNAITEKRLLEAILAARDHEDGCLFSAITDCGAGGFSSAVGEMGQKLGAEVCLERAPLKYAGLSYTEIWISEAQERMVLAVPEANVARLAEICHVEDVDLCDLGTFGTPDRELILRYDDVEVGRLSMEFMHHGLPAPEREAVWIAAPNAGERSARSDGRVPLNLGVAEAANQVATESAGTTQPRAAAEKMLLSLLAHPNIASRHWIIRQYDYEVQGQSVVRPLVGPDRIGPSDAAVITPLLGSSRGLAIANGLATGLAEDPYWMALAAVDECVRNLVCVGADPARIAVLDNFCWPSCDTAERLGSLVRAAAGCYDAALAFGTPFISGKDSLNNQFTTESGATIAIPPTLLIFGFGIVPDVAQCVTMDAKRAGNLLLIVGWTGAALGGSHLLDIVRAETNGELPDDSPNALAQHDLPHVDLEIAPRLAAAVARLISAGLIRSAHDCSDGGLLVAAAEMSLAGRLGLELDLSAVPSSSSSGEVQLDLPTRCFAESPSRFLLEAKPDDLARIKAQLGDLPWATIGRFNETRHLRIPQAGLDLTNEQLRTAWRSTLDW